MLVVLYIVVVVLGWMIFRVRAEGLDGEDSEVLDSDDLDADNPVSGDIDSGD